MKFAPNGFKPGLTTIMNGEPTESAHAIAVDRYSTYMAASYKFNSPATCVNPMSEIVGTGYTDKGWARYMLWVPPFTKYVGFEFWASGSGTVTVSTPNDSTDGYTIQVPVDTPGWNWLDSNGEWDPSEYAFGSGITETTKDRWLINIYGGFGGVFNSSAGKGQLFQSGPPMPNPNVHNKNRAINCAFKRFPHELEVHVRFDNESGDKIGILVWPMNFFFYTPGESVDLSTASAS